MALSVKRFPVRKKRIKSWQRNVRRAFDSFVCEVAVITLVILYALIIFADLAYTAARDTEAPEWDEAMRHCDIVLLSIFMVEICLRLFGFGTVYLRDCINVVDAVVVLVSWVLTLLPPSVVSVLAWFRLFRIMRLFRFAIIINKLQRSREAAAMTRKRNMYRKAGAPVEKVLDFFEDLRSRMPEKKAQEYLTWMMEVVCEGDLYRVRNFDADTVKRLGELGGGDDMSAFISQATGIATSNTAKDKEATATATATASASATSITRRFSLQMSREATARHLALAAADRHPPSPSEEKPERPVWRARRPSGGQRTSPDSTPSPTPERRPSVPTFTPQSGLWADAMLCDAQLASMLSTLSQHEEAWGFDVLAFDRLCKQKVGYNQPHYPATLLAYYLLNQHHLFAAFPSLDSTKLLNWLQAVEAAYLPSNPYHTALHAAAVTVNLAFFLGQPMLSRQLTPLDMLAALLAAVAHDVGHPGVNNGFLEATRADVAVTYNDQAILEHHHAALAFRLAYGEDCDWLSGLEEEQHRELRETVCYMVLGTEMKSHFEVLAKFRSRVADEGFATAERLERKDVRLLLLVALHAADMADPAKPLAIAVEWAARAMDEFFAQGDREAELGLPVSAFMDRKKVPLAPNVLNSQVGLINVLTRPFFEEWTGFLGGASSVCLYNLYENIRFWETEGEEAIRTHPSFLARWSTKRKLLMGATRTVGLMPKAQPVTATVVATAGTSALLSKAELLSSDI